MSLELLIVGGLAILAVAFLVYKVVKAAVVFGLAAAAIYVGSQYLLPFWETHLAPIAGSYF